MTAVKAAVGRYGPRPVDTDPIRPGDGNAELCITANLAANVSVGSFAQAPQFRAMSAMAPIATELMHRSETTRCAKTGPDWGLRIWLKARLLALAFSSVTPSHQGEIWYVFRRTRCGPRSWGKHMKRGVVARHSARTAIANAGDRVHQRRVGCFLFVSKEQSMSELSDEAIALIKQQWDRFLEQEKTVLSEMNIYKWALRTFFVVVLGGSIYGVFQIQNYVDDRVARHVEKQDNLYSGAVFTATGNPRSALEKLDSFIMSVSNDSSANQRGSSRNVSWDLSNVSAEQKTFLFISLLAALAAIDDKMPAASLSENPNGIRCLPIGFFALTCYIPAVGKGTRNSISIWECLICISQTIKPASPRLGTISLEQIKRRPKKTISGTIIGLSA
jgi:hypothetical protein